MAAGYAGSRLVDLLCDLYAETRRQPDALALREAYFADQPNEHTYGQLRAAAEPLDRWGPVRRSAHAILRQRTAAGIPFAADIVARILVSEGEPDAAWRVFRQNKCGEETALAVAAVRAVDHPADAIEVYRTIVERYVAVTNNDGYRVAAEHLATMRPLFDRVGDEFDAYVAALRDRHHRKRNFLSELDRRGW
jgi:uncharacterized Zn finger protein